MNHSSSFITIIYSHWERKNRCTWATPPAENVAMMEAENDGRIRRMTWIYVIGFHGFMGSGWIGIWGAKTFWQMGLSENRVYSQL